MDYFGISPKEASHFYTVQPEDVASFNGKVVHEVLSTFVLTREAEWAGRLVLLPLLREGEEGIGTSVQITHLGPAFVGETIELVATPISITDGELIVAIKVMANKRPVATGTTGQKILPKSVIQKLFAKARQA